LEKSAPFRVASPRSKTLREKLPIFFSRPQKQPKQPANQIMKTSSISKAYCRFPGFIPGQLLQTLVIAIVLVMGGLVPQSAQAIGYFWDSNGATAGAGLDPTGTWGDDPYWTTSSTGTDTTSNPVTTTGDNLSFSAGSDTTGPYTVTLDGTQYAKSITARTGNLTLAGGTLALAKNTSNGDPFLVTSGTANLTLNSGLLVDNSGSGNKFINFSPAAGTTITINGIVGATDAYSGTTNRIFIRHVGDGAVIINTDLGTNTNLKDALNTATSLDGVSGSGVLTLNGSQTLESAGLAISAAGKTGTVNLGGTVDTNYTVKLAAIAITHATNDLTGATINMNSRVLLGDKSVTVRSGGVVNIAGSLETTGGLVLGYGAAGGSAPGGAINILQGGVATVGNVDVANDLTLKVGGALNAARLRLGDTNNTTGTLVLGSTNGVGTATFTGLTTQGTSTNHAIVGGHGSISTLILSNTSSQTFTGRLGGTGTYENNLELIKKGSAGLILSGENTYHGNTTIMEGTLTLDQDGSLSFTIGASGVNNSILGTGTVQLDGKFVFDLSGAAPNGSWNIVDVGSLTESFTGTFVVVGFTDLGDNTWENTVGPATYTFNEVTGMLTAVPEPGTWLLFFSGVGFLLAFHRYRVGRRSRHPALQTSHDVG